MFWWEFLTPSFFPAGNVFVSKKLKNGEKLLTLSAYCLLSFVNVLFFFSALLDAKRRVVVGEECVINVDKSMAGEGNVTAKIFNPSRQPTDIDIEDNKDGTVSIYYTPRQVGTYLHTTHPDKSVRVYILHT